MVPCCRIKFGLVTGCLNQSQSTVTLGGKRPPMKERGPVSFAIYCVNLVASFGALGCLQSHIIEAQCPLVVRQAMINNLDGAKTVLVAVLVVTSSSRKTAS